MRVRAGGSLAAAAGPAATGCGCPAPRRRAPPPRRHRTARAPTAVALSSPAASSHTSLAAPDRRQRQRDPGGRRLGRAAHADDGAVGLVQGAGAPGRARPRARPGRRPASVRRTSAHRAAVLGPRGRAQLVGVRGGRGLHVVAVTGRPTRASGAPAPGRAAPGRAAPHGPGSRCAPDRPRAGTARRPTTGPARAQSTASRAGAVGERVQRRRADCARR